MDDLVKKRSCPGVPRARFESWQRPTKENQKDPLQVSWEQDMYDEDSVAYLGCSVQKQLVRRNA